MENPPIFHGKIHYFYGHFQLLCGSSPEGNDQDDSSYSYGHLLVITGYKWDYTIYK